MPIEAIRSRGITREDVWQAADALLKAGHRPTIERIRLHLGRGSPNTVSPHLDAWFAAVGGRLQDGQGLVSTPAYPDPVGKAARYLWESALAEARTTMEASLAEREARLREAEARLAREQAALAQEREVLQARLEGAAEAAAALTRARDEALERAAQAEAATAGLQQQAAAQRAASDTVRQEKDNLQRELAAQRAAWDQERELMAERAAANERRMALELDAARLAVKDGQKLLEAERKAALERLAHAAELATRQGSQMNALGNAIAVLEERVRQRESLLTEYRQQLEAGATPPVQAAPQSPRRPRPARPVPAIGRGGRLRKRPVP